MLTQPPVGEELAWPGLRGDNQAGMGNLGTHIMAWVQEDDCNCGGTGWARGGGGGGGGTNPFTLLHVIMTQ